MPSHIEIVRQWNRADAKNHSSTTFKLSKNAIVFDAGAYVGAWSEKIIKKYNCNIYAFEPVPQFYKKALNTLQKYNNVKVFNYAIGGNTRKDNISLAKDGSAINKHGKLTVDVKSICDIIKELNIEKIDLLKLNVEGSEYEILDSMISNDILGICNTYLIQFHRTINEFAARRKKIRAALSKTHKQLFNYEFVWEAWSKK